MEMEMVIKFLQIIFKELLKDDCPTLQQRRLENTFQREFNSNISEPRGEKLINIALFTRKATKL